MILRALVGLLLLLTMCACSCGSNDPRPVVWIYTSLYKDTVDDVSARLEKAFPQYRFQFFQSGSEEVAAKVSAEELAGGTRADVLIFSDRFWFEEMADHHRLHTYLPRNAERVLPVMRRADNTYAAVSYPLMVLVYNSLKVSDVAAPRAFKDLASPKWKGQIATGSPLASGTNFTTVAFLQKSYGWDYFKALRQNDVVSEGGNGSVIRRLETGERSVGWVLLESVLRLKASKIKFIYPGDGAILQSNNLAIIEKKESREAAEKVADWFFGPDGQAAMAHSFMYGAVPGTVAPNGALPYDEMMAKTRPWTSEIVHEFMKTREDIKEQFAQLVLQ